MSSKARAPLVCASAAASEQGTSRRCLFLGAASAIAASALLPSMPAMAEGAKIVVVGATGNSGKRVVKQLQAAGYEVTAGVRTADKAKKAGYSNFAIVDVNDDVATQAKALAGAEVVICCTGFIPGNPFKMGEAAKAVDNEGTVRLVDASVAAGAKKFVLISSILTNGRAWGKEKAPGFVITNAFGQVLDQKIIAENHLRKSGMDWTIVRPGGLKDDEPKGSLVISPEDTLASGEISRDLVASVVVRAATSEGAKNKVLEIVETGTCVADQCPADVDSKGLGKDPASWF